MAEPKPLPEALPDCVLRLFWDCDPASLSGSKDRFAVIDRVLAGGGLDAMRWLRAHADDDALRDVIRCTEGRRLSRRRLRFWQAILGLPDAEVTAWLSEPGRAIWDERQP